MDTSEQYINMSRITIRKYRCEIIRKTQRTKNIYLDMCMIWNSLTLEQKQRIAASFAHVTAKYIEAGSLISSTLTEAYREMSERTLEAMRKQLREK